ncbi:MAG: SGNH/GDSL hydrolase family protein [Patescibacteria group bacterium]
MIYIKLLVLLSLIVAYLTFSYVRFYHFIGDVNLKSPYRSNQLMIGTKQENKQITYVALGDSLTAGVGSSDFTKTFPYLFASKLSQNNAVVKLLNLGLPGGTTTDVLKDQLPQAISENPEYITLLIGINDLHNKQTLSTFKQNYYYILSQLLTKTRANITVINIPYLGASKIVYPPFNLFLNYRTRQFNEVISILTNTSTQAGRLKLIDLYTNTYSIAKQNPSYYSTDLFHPSAEGYLIWGELINAN